MVSAGIICADAAQKLDSARHFSQLKADSDFGIKGNPRSGLTFDTLEENNRKNVRVASFLREQDPLLADKLLGCSNFVQQQNDGLWKASKRCRQMKICLTCQAIRSQQIRQQFEAASVCFEVATQTLLRLCSFVLHPQVDPDIDANMGMSLSLQTIDRFGERFARWRTKQNTNWLLAADGRAGRASSRGLVGPALLVTHVDPAAAYRVPGKRIIKPERSHLHLLVAMPNRFPVRDFQKTLTKIWHTAAERSIVPLDVVVNKKAVNCESADHVSNLIAYAARPIKSRWNQEQTVAAYNRIQHTPRRAMMRVLGATSELAKLPHRTPITGEMFEFSADEMKFLPTFKRAWV